MTKVEAIWSHVAELSRPEREELIELISRSLENDDLFSAKEMAEIYRRIADYESGKAVFTDADIVMQRLNDSLRTPAK